MKLGQTSSRYASPDGVLDMSGNVCEWCLTNSENPAPDAAKEDMRSHSDRVLRGGSWSSDQNVARAAYRKHAIPYFRGYYIGFRVVLSSPI